MCYLDNEGACAPITTYAMLIMVYNCNTHYIAFLLAVLAECVFAGAMLALLALFVARVVRTAQVFKTSDACALYSIVVGGCIVSILWALTQTAVAEAFVVTGLLFQGLFLVAAVELHGSFEDPATRF